MASRFRGRITENRETVASQLCNASVCVSRVVRANCKTRGVGNILNFDLLSGRRIDGVSQRFGKSRLGSVSNHWQSVL